MFCVCVRNTVTDSIYWIMDRCHNLDDAVSYALEKYNDCRVEMWDDVLVLETDAWGYPDPEKLVGWVGYDLDPRTGYMTRINPVFVMMPKYKTI